jgi:opacity protein-like surface antigen
MIPKATALNVICGQHKIEITLENLNGAIDKMKNTTNIVLLACALLLSSSFAKADDWSYEFEPYMLLSSIEGDTSIGRVSGAPVDVNFGDILEVLDAGVMAHFEAQNSNGWGLSLDYGFMDLRQDSVSPRGGVQNARLRQGVLEALLTKRHKKGEGYVDYFAGFRWWDNDIFLSIDPAVLPGGVRVDINEDWIDLVFGVRMMKPVSEKWKMYLRGDIGGFGIQSDFTSLVSIGFRYEFSDRMDFDVQYKALWADYENGTAGQPGFYAYDTVTHGPILGLVFKF